MGKVRCKTSKDGCCRTCSVLITKGDVPELEETNQNIADATAEVKKFAGKNGNITAATAEGFYFVTGCKKRCKKKYY